VSRDNGCTTLGFVRPSEVVRVGAPAVVETTPRPDDRGVVFRDSASSTGFVETTPRPDGQDVVFRNSASSTGFVETAPRPDGQDVVFRDSASSTEFVETASRPDGQDVVFRDSASSTGFVETTPLAPKVLSSLRHCLALERRNWCLLPNLLGLYTPERPKIRPGSVYGTRMFARWACALIVITAGIRFTPIFRN